MARAFKICPKHGCPRIAAGRYCPEHNAAHDKERGTKAERGYDANFYSVRREYVEQHMVQALTCVRCGEPIPIGQPFHLDHDDFDRTIIKGPAHPTCNTSAGGTASHRYD